MTASPLRFRTWLTPSLLTIAFFLFSAFLFLSTVSTQAELPFSTEEAETLAPGMVSIDFGIGYRDEPRDWALPDRKSQWELGETRVSFGLGRIAELQVSGAMARLVELPGQDRETDNADWTIGTKIWLLQPQARRPSMSILIGVKLPNGDDAIGASTDETDVSGHFLLTHQLAPRHFLHANAGIAILGSPLGSGEQNDVYQLRLAWEHRVSAQWLVGLEALVQRGPKEGDDPRYFRLITARELKPGWALHGAIGIGSGDDADGFEVHLGVRHRFRLFNPDARPTRYQRW